MSRKVFVVCVYVKLLCYVFMSARGDYECVDKKVSGVCVMMYFSEVPVPSPPRAH